MQYTQYGYYRWHLLEHHDVQTCRGDWQSVNAIKRLLKKVIQILMNIEN
jgi:hypothetical protein